MLPEKLYKYESFSTQALTNLKSCQLYFSTPNKFNDPFDCTLPISYDIDFGNVGRIRTMLSSDHEIAHLCKSEIDRMNDDELYEKVILLLDKKIIKYMESKGVSCFSSEKSNMLMWSHYGEKHTGFCLEFDTSIKPFNKAKKVKYVRNFPKLSVKDLLINQKFQEIISLLHTKSIDWKYENEWRCIHVEAPKLYSYDKKSLTGVYFGAKMDQCAIEIIFLILQGQNPNVKFWRGRKCSDKFGVEFKQCYYIPHLNKNT
jgi:hypothetical protein